MLEMSVIGEKELLAELDRLISAFPKAAAEALFEEALLIENASAREVPVEHGTLLRSRKTTTGKLFGDDAVVISYGTNYAIYVHERTELRHASPTKAKFLEDPVNKAKDGWEERLAGRIQKKVRIT